MANHYNVLFVCTNNASRSIMAEAILSQVGMGMFAGYSAGSHPAARVHPEAMRQMELAQMGVAGYRTKSWEMFAWPGAPRMDFVITLCDDAWNHPQPHFPGSPTSMHWPTPDPEEMKGSLEEMRGAFGRVFGLLNERIRKMVERPAAAVGKEALRKELARMSKPVRMLAASESAEPVAEAGCVTDLIPA